MLGYDKDRVEKISQIMPQFAKVAQPGDKVLMGLEGDPLYPKKYNMNRPEATIEHIDYRDNDALVTLKMSDGSLEKVSSMTLAADQVWEFTDDSFRNVMDRQKKQNSPEPEYRGSQDDEISMLKKEIAELKSNVLYRGSNDLVSDLQSEVDSLKKLMSEEKETNRNFHNTMIASLNEMANDICKLDSNADFCKVLNTEYTKLMKSRAEGSLPTKTTTKMSAAENDESEDDDVESFSADETDFF